MDNKTFNHALRTLAHPLSLGAMLILFLNDQLQRGQWAAWWTGKLGDVVWLFFVPFMLAAVLAWLLPRRMHNHKTWVGAAAIGLTGLGFSLANTLPAAQPIIVSILERTLGFPVGLVCDPTDLLTLPALVGAWRLWQRPSSTSQMRMLPGLLALSLAAGFTMADTALHEEGVICIHAEDGIIYADDALLQYESTDNGISWREIYLERDLCNPGNSTVNIVLDVDNDALTMVGTSDPHFSFRHQNGLPILERSTDGGATWSSEPVVLFPSLPVRLFHIQHGGYFSEGPVDATFDEATGDVYFAMAYQGVLVRRSNGNYKWLPLNSYQKIETQKLSRSQASSMIQDQLLLAIGVGVMTFCTTLVAFKQIQWWRILTVVIGWPALYYGAWQTPVTVKNIGGYGFGIDSLGIGLAFLPIIPAFAVSVIHLKQFRQWRSLLLLPLGLLAGVGFHAPYYYWAVETIQHYRTAALIAISLSACITLLSTGLAWAWNRKVPTAGYPKDQEENGTQR